MDAGTLRGATVLVTGAGSGIGAATALRAAASGALSVAVDVRPDRLEALARSAEELGLEVRTQVADVTDRASVDRAIEAVVESCGTPTGVVASAGTTTEVPFLELSLDEWAAIVDLNLTGTFVVAQRIARRMVERDTGGSIVTVSSSQGQTGRARGAHYAASKAGVIGLTKSMALELATHHIRVNCVAPGPVDTPLLRRILDRAPGGAEASLSRVPLGRFGEADEVAAAICFLLSDDAGWITGHTLHVNGGLLMA